MSKGKELTDDAHRRLTENFIDALRALAADDYDGRDAVVAQSELILNNPNSVK